MTSDEALMFEFQRGSRNAFDELFARYHGPLYGFFRRRLWIAERAEDLTQETFLAVVRAIRHYEPRSTVRTYLYAIAMNLLAAERRRQARDKDVQAPDSDAGALAEPSFENRSETVLWVRQALEKLDATDREILMLREYEQISYSEIGQLLRLPVNTVRSRLFRARIALKDRLQPEPEARPRSAVVAMRRQGSAKAGTAESEA